MKNPYKVSKFQGGLKGAVYTCSVCGKKTRETGDGESSCNLCKKCYYEGGLENEHSDNGGVHQFGYGANMTEGKHPDCPLCKAGL
jgi:hypothetical protein